MKKVIALLILAILTLLHGACGGGYKSPTAPGGAPTPMPGSGPTPTPPRY